MRHSFKASQEVPEWLDEIAESAVGTSYGPAGGRFASRDTRRQVCTNIKVSLLHNYHNSFHQRMIPNNKGFPNFMFAKWAATGKKINDLILTGFLKTLF